VLGLPPVWYKSFAYRSRTVKEPRAVLREFGVTLPEGTEIRVWDSTAEVRYMVLPMRPAGTEGWSEERLAELVTRDSSLARLRSPDGFNPLHYPAFFGGRDAAATARVLLDAGADVNARSDNDLSVLPIHSAVAGGHDDVIAVLIAAGADLNARQSGGYAPLHGAAQNGAIATIDRLLAAGADRGARNDAGRTPADLASEAGHAEVAARLR
jgi:ankyrin repeat protein